MKTATVKENLNQRGPAVDAEILSYLRACAERNQGWASPSLIDVARMSKSSVFVVRERLRHFTQTGTVVEETRTVGAMEEVGWIVPPRKQKRPQTAAGFGGGDREFLRQCGVAAEG